MIGEDSSAFSLVSADALLTAMANWRERFATPRHDQFNYAYGDTSVASRYIGLPKPPNRINGEWQHGAIIPERNQHPDLIIGSDGLSQMRRDKRYFVARTDQVIALNGFGYADVHAIGLPFAYVTLPSVKRIPRTLLAMPAHGLPGTGSRIIADYADYVAERRHTFQDVVVCLHRADYTEFKIKELFHERGLPVICGADPDDANAYDAIASLLSLFDVVTSNEFGSHIVYAAMTGAKVSIAGPPPKFDRGYWEKLPYYQNCPAVLDLLEDLVASHTLERNYPFLFGEPEQAESCKAWAANQIGVQNRRGPFELRRLFGWAPSQLAFRKVRKTVDRTWSGIRKGMNWTWR